MAHDVFISHSARDKAVADAVCAFLEQRAIRCWIAPRDIVHGENWGGAIIRAIKGSRVMVLVFSESSNRSEQVLREVSNAATAKVVILPLRIEDVVLSEDLEYYLTSVHWLDALTPPLENYLKLLSDTVARHVKAASGTSAQQAPRAPAPSAAAPAAAPPPPAAPRKKETVRLSAPLSPPRSTVTISLPPRPKVAELAPQAKAAAPAPRKKETVRISLPPRPKVAAPAPQAPRADIRRAGEAMTNGIGMVLCWCPAGKFTMGSPKDELGRRGNEDQVAVELTQGFWMGKFPVTQAEYQRVAGTGPSLFKGERLPVEQVNWDEAVEFCRKLTEAERAAGKLRGGMEYRLPTEAQWEHACRAGTTTALNSGKNLTSADGECANLDLVGWYDKNSGAKTHPVGEKEPNGWGMHDMHGNVLEWCADWYGDRLGGGRDPAGPNSGKCRVLRGGSWCNSAGLCRSADRDWVGPGYRLRGLGFRVCLVPGPGEGNR